MKHLLLEHFQAMFTGIIEDLAKVEEITSIDGNSRVLFSSRLSAGLRLGQSLSHDGVCLSIEGVRANKHQVTIIPETLKKTSLAFLKPGDMVNLEAPVKAGREMDGHFVQGHVDTRGKLREIKQVKGAYEITVAYPRAYENLAVACGSIALHGISLTLAGIGKADDPRQSLFSVCMIPYTYENTNVSKWKKDSLLNIEFDILGKYVLNALSSSLSNKNQTPDP